MSDETFDRAQRDYEDHISAECPADDEQIQFDKHDWKADIARDDKYE